MNTDQARSWLDKATEEAQAFIQSPSKVDELLIQLEKKLQDVPTIGKTLSNLPTMIAMVKAWITKEYTEVSPKVIACLVGAVIYLLKQNDLINDRIPVVGHLDDMAVMGLALKLSEPELEAFKAWREKKMAAVPVKNA